MRHLELDSLPSMPALLLRGLLRRRPPVPEKGPLPEIEAIVRDVRFPADLLRRYQAVTGSPPPETLRPDTLPPAALHLLAGPLHGAIFAEPSFPLGLAGLVHVRNTIVSRRPVRPDEPLTLLARVGPTRRLESGLEFDLLTDASAAEEHVWHETTTILWRTASAARDAAAKKAGRGKERPIPAGEEPAPSRSVVLRFGPDAGRRYSRVSGDWNPIHLWPWSARLFGFKRPILHGMASLARALAEARDDLPAGAFRVECSFRRPILLPARVWLRVDRREDGFDFVLGKEDATGVYVTGSVRPERT